MPVKMEKGDPMPSSKKRCSHWLLGFKAGNLVVSQNPDLFMGQIVRVVTARRKHVPDGHVPVVPPYRRRTNKDAFVCIPAEDLYIYGPTAGKVL